MTTKRQIIAEIGSLLGFEAPFLSTGSTEPKSFFILINRALGLGIDPSSGKQALARGIVEASGMVWDADCESTGRTVTLKGMEAVARSVRFLVE